MLNRTLKSPIYMLQRIKSFFVGNPFLIILPLVVCVLSLMNYRSGTILTGWDNLHSEFNLPLNIGRSLSSVWQEYQGLGLVGGMAHASDISRLLLLLPLSILVPLNLMRYTWTFLMLFIGPLGAYFLFQFLLKGKKLSASLGSLFYLLNLATVQYFFTPYESFISFFGFLPWFLLSALYFLEGKDRRRILFVIATFLLGSSAFYVQTLFVVTMMVIGIFAIERIIRKGRKEIQSVVSLFGTILLSTAFWLLPVVYFSVTNLQVVGNSAINKIATVETQYMNQSFGDLSRIARLQGFWFEYIDTQDGKYDYLMKSWREHAALPLVELAGYALFALVILAVGLSVRRYRKQRYALSFVVVLFFAIVMLSGGNGIFGLVFNAISNSVPFFGQLFRSSFTKWSPAAALIFGWGIAITFESIGLLSHKIGKARKVLVPIVVLMISGLMVCVTVPAFNGNLISENMRLKMPDSYMKVFDYFSNEPQESRIAVLPAHGIWGWSFYDWGYRGSGFLWYGIKQPILDRAFDVWSNKNEGFYLELKTALYRGDALLLKNVLTKYRVSYVLLDESVVIPESKGVALNYANSKDMLLTAGWGEAWQDGELTVFKASDASNQFIESGRGIESVSAPRGEVFVDHAFKGQDYIDGTGNVYPFRSLVSPIVTHDLYKFDFYGNANLSLSSSLPVDDTNSLIIPPLKSFEASGIIKYDGRVVTIEFNDPANIGRLQTAPLSPLYIETVKSFEKITIAIGGSVFTVNQGGNSYFGGVRVDTKRDLQIYVFDASSQLPVSLDAQVDTPYNKCWERNSGQGGFELERNADGETSITTHDVVACVSYKIGSFPKSAGFLSVSLPFKSSSRARPDFCLVKEGQTKCLHDEVFYSETTSTDWKSVVRSVVIEDNAVYWLVLSARPSDTPNEKWSIQYKMPQVQMVSASSIFTVSPSFWEELASERTIELDASEKNLEVTIPLSSHPISITNSGRGGEYNCDLFKRGTVERIISGTSVTYGASSRGTECDYLLLSDISSKHDYIFRFTGENISGRSLKASLFNQLTEKNDIEELLPKGKFDSSFTLLRSSATEANDFAYTLNLESRSFGEKTENRLDKAIAYSAPLEWLSEWKVVTSKKENFVETNYKQTRKIGTWFYSGTLTSNTGGVGVITLSQGYEKGWVLVSRGRIHNPVEFNLWGNAWRVPVESGDQSIYVIYVPQFLEFIGLISVTLLVVLIKVRNRNK